jgi:hypothetical protein
MVSDYASCSDADVVALALSFVTISPSIFLIRSCPVINAVYSELVWYTTYRSQWLTVEICWMSRVFPWMVVV